MTIPMLISKYQKRVIETTLKEDFSIFSQVNRMMIANDVAFNMDAADNDAAALLKWVETYMFPYMKVSSVCPNGKKGCWSDNIQTSELSGKKFTDCRTGYGCGGGSLSFIMDNGTKVALDFGNNWQLRNIFGIDSTAPTCLKMYVDVNGDKKPNRFGIDIFLMTFTEDGFVPAGVSKTQAQLKSNCDPNSSGYWCLAYVKNLGWTIPDDIWKSRNNKLRD